MDFGLKVFFLQSNNLKGSVLILALTNRIFTECKTKYKMSKTDSFQSPVRIEGAATSVWKKDLAGSVLVKLC